MAESSTQFQSQRQEWLELLMGLKSVVEGLLASQSTNVWTTYGGLRRLTIAVHSILNHRLKVTQSPYGSALDFWYFVNGLRWLNPVMAPFIEKVSRSGSTDDGRGERWIRQSLLEHNISSQLQTLASNLQHLQQHYYEEAFLYQKEYVQAMLICLQSVEQNKAALLAEINPYLLKLKSGRHPPKLSHVRSASLPVVCQETEPIMIRRTGTVDPLAPNLALSMKTNSSLSISGDTARPCSVDSSPECAKDALIGVLNKSGEGVETGEDAMLGQGNDPLMEVYSTEIFPNFHRSMTMPALSINAPSYQDQQSASRSTQNSQILDRILNIDEGEQRLYDVQDVDEESLPAPTCQTGRMLKHSKRSSSMDSGLVLLSPSEHDTNTWPQAQLPKKLAHVRSMSDYGIPHKVVEQDEDVKADGVDSLSSSLPDVQTAVKPSKDKDKHPVQESAVFRQPTKGQSLTSFLSSQDFHTCAELDKENAHFSISEALIAAIEQMKCNQVLWRPESDHEGDSDEEIQQLKQRIRIRRRERMKEKARGFPALSDGKTDTTTTTSCSSVLSSPAMSVSDSGSSESSSDQVHDSEVAEVDASVSTDSNLTSLKESGLSLSLASLYSDADLLKNKAIAEQQLKKQGTVLESFNCQVSAESVALSLLKKFSENQLPKASELEWLVSEQDAPQALLPLPDSFPVSPDEGENADLLSKTMRIRGNLEWAPPRAQIIFNIHPTPKRKVLLAKQNYRCAGCGAKVEPGFMKRYHYCDYLGKYFCPCCHSNDLAHIPGRILRKWDFTKHHVSNFARDLLVKIHHDPLFNIQDTNPGLYRKVRVLEQVYECRLQLSHLWKFLMTCRLGYSMYEELQKYPRHWINDVHIYSIADLVMVKFNKLLSQLKCLINDSISHISQCPLCQARGFVCELCNNDSDIIFPYELNKVTQCEECRACYHIGCYVPEKCPKCSRLETRKHHLAEVQTSSSEEELYRGAEQL